MKFEVAADSPSSAFPSSSIYLCYSIIHRAMHLRLPLLLLLLATSRAQESLEGEPVEARDGAEEEAMRELMQAALAEEREASLEEARDREEHAAEPLPQEEPRVAASSEGATRRRDGRPRSGLSSASSGGATSLRAERGARERTPRSKVSSAGGSRAEASVERKRERVSELERVSREADRLARRAEEAGREESARAAAARERARLDEARMRVERKHARPVERALRLGGVAPTYVRKSRLNLSLRGIIISASRISAMSRLQPQRQLLMRTGCWGCRAACVRRT